MQNDNQILSELHYAYPWNTDALYDTSSELHVFKKEQHASNQLCAF